MKYKFRKRNIGIVSILLMFGITACTPQALSGPESVESPESVMENVTEISNIPSTNSTEKRILEVHFLNVGQGDATLIKCGEDAMLIDTGPNSMGTKLQLYLMKQGIEELDYLVLTHPDADHIGGGDVIVTKYDIGKVFLGNFEKDGASYEELLEAFEYRNMKYSVPEVGSTHQLGEAEFTILAPNRTYKEANNSSIALLLKHGENSFLFTGDCKTEAEADIMANGLDIDCDVYKVAHHGSQSSSSKEFLETITPKVAVISCGTNDYGHPHADVLENLQEMGAEVYRTDEQGDIVAYSDVAGIVWKVDPGQSQQVGGPKEEGGTAEGVTKPTAEVPDTYIIANKNSGVFHKSSCAGLPAEGNRILFETKEEAIESGFTNPCNYCRP